MITEKGAAGSEMLSFPCDFLGDVIPSQKERERGVENKGNREEGSSAEMNFSKERERRRRSSA